MQVVQDQHEFVAAEARDGVAHAHAARQALRDVAQELVADGVAERVVHDLEAVEIEEHHGGDALAALRLRQRLPQPVEKEHAVG